MNIYTDGSSPFNKRYPSAYCVSRGGKLIYSKVLDRNLPAQDVEYLALIKALVMIIEKELTADKFKIFTDCGYMVLELRKKRTPKNKALYKIASTLLWLVRKNTKLIIIPRDINPAGEYLEERLEKLRDEVNEVMHPEPNPELKRLKYKKYKCGQCSQSSH